MDVIKELKAGIDAIAHPDKGTKKKMAVGASLRMYYKFSIIPGILYLFAAGIIGAINPAVGLGTGASAAFAAAMGALLVWVIIPILMLVAALIYHVFAMMFGLGGKYANTLAAVAFMEMAGVSVMWVGIIPILGAIVEFVVWIWSIWVFVCAMANQHGASKGKAFIVWLMPTIIIIAIIGVVAFSLFAA